MSGTLNRVSNKALGELLIEKGYLTAEKCEQGLQFSKQEGVRLGEALIQLGYISNDVLSYSLGEQFGVRPVELDSSMVDINLVRRFPVDLLRRHLILPLIEVGDEIVVVISDPNDTRGLQAISNLAPTYRILAQIGDPRQIRRCLESPQFASLKGGGYVPTPVPTDWESEYDLKGSAEPNLAHWLVTTAIQRPEADLLVRNDGANVRVFRRSHDQTGAASVELIHSFGVIAFASVSDELWQNCIPVSYTGGSVGMWRAPLRFAGKRFGLEVAVLNDSGGSALRLKPLIHEESVLEKQAVAKGSGAVLGSVAVVLYESRERLETLLSKFLAMQPDNQIVVLFQENTRYLYPRALAFPSMFTDCPTAVASLGATFVVFDHPLTLEQFARTRHASSPFPAMVVCAPVNTKNEAPPGKPSGLELRPKIAPDVVDIISLYKPDVIYLGQTGDEVTEMSSFSALEFLGVSK